VNMPYNIAAANSAGYNYSSSKMDSQGFVRTISANQRWFEQRMIDDCVASVAQELRMSGAVKTPAGVPPADLDKSESHWQPFEHADPSREANGLKTKMGLKVTTFIAACQREGRDWRKVIDEHSAADKYAAEKEVALTPAPPAAAAAPGAPAPAADGAARELLDQLIDMIEEDREA